MAKKTATMAASLFLVSLASVPRLTNAEGKSNALLKLTSNYVYRSYSKSNGNPDIQGNIDYEHSSGLFLGAWMSHVDFGDSPFKGRSQLEANLYTGVTRRLAKDWRIDATLAGYLYDGKVFRRSANYGEINASLHLRDLLTTRLAVAHDPYGRSGATVDYELQIRYPATDTLEVSGSVGYEDATAVFGYSNIYWNVGIACFMSKHVAFDLRYYGAHHITEAEAKETQASVEPPRIGNQLVFSISIGF
jgi:uncharacterized protein (TIGR02001 family)